MLVQSERFTLQVDVEWPSHSSFLVAKATACHPPSYLISPWWMTNLRSCSAVLSLKKRTQTQRNAWSSSKTGPAQGTITAAQPLKGCQMTFFSLTPRCNSSKSSSTMVKSNHLVGGRLLLLLRERLEDLAILRRLAARYQLQVCNPESAHSTIQTTRAFSRRLFLVNHLLHTILYHTWQWV